MTVLRCGLIGAGLSRSRFGAALELLARAHGVSVDYTLIDTGRTDGFDFAKSVERLRREGWAGVSVTHPFKTDAARWAGTAMAPEAARLGACNLLIFRPDLVGRNTDRSGFVGAWRAKFGTRRPGRVAMAGAGGVARAVGAALIALGAEEIVVRDEIPERARALAEILGDRVRVVDADTAGKAAISADGLVNATPLGMGSDRRSAFPADWVGRQSWAFDAVYTPVDTPFLQVAGARGLDCLTGFDLFRFMAIDSFAAYADLSPDPSLASLLDPLRPKETA